MWQITWVLGLLPEWFWTLVLIIGIAGVIASWILQFIPFISKYKLPIQVIGILLTVSGVYYEGFYSNEAKWQAKVTELEEKLKVAEEKSKEVNVEIVTKYKDRVKVVTDTKVVIQEKIVKEKEFIDKECRVPEVAIDIHNDAAKNKKPGDSK